MYATARNTKHLETEAFKRWQLAQLNAGEVELDPTERQIFGGLERLPQRFLVPHHVYSMANAKAGSGSSEESSQCLQGWR